MSSYSDINQLLEEMGASARSAGDPWIISRSNQGVAKSDSFSPAVVADLGAPAQNLTSEIQSADQIARADAVVMSPTGSPTSGSSTASTGSGILGGFLSLFPLASAVGKLFGLGGSSKPAPLTSYIQPPSISFEGALSGSLSDSTTSSLPGAPGSVSASQPGSSSSFAPGVTTLSYGANGLPRTAEMSSPVSVPGEMPEATATLPSNSSLDVVGQLSSLTSSNFTSEPAASSPVPSTDLAATTTIQAPGSSSLRPASSGNGAAPQSSDATGSSSQQGQNILVQVQAMDSQSFMDRSNDIAQAVRQAMLNLHSVNDVIADL